MSRRPEPALTLALVLLAAAVALAGCGRGPGRPAPSVERPPATSMPTTPSAPATPSADGTAVTDFTPGAPWPRLVLTGRWSGLDQPLYLTASPAAPDRVYIVEKTGRVRTASRSGGALEREPFLDIADKVSDGGEQGLLSIAFPPNAEAARRRFYAYYTDRSGDVVISRFRIGANGRAERASEQEVLRVAHRQFSNHNGGQLQFGPDGHLYAGVGDGGSGGDPNGNGQNRGVLLAKLLRISVEPSSAEATVPKTYTVPRDNPYAGMHGGPRPEIWAYGLRNPWRFSFDAATGDLYIADVGQDAWEEIDFQPAGSKGGEDFGWNLREGKHPFRSRSSDATLTDPVAEYGRQLGISVSGGYVYRGSASPALAGVYLFGDYGSGRVWGLRREAGQWRTRELTKTGYSIASFGEDAERELYLLDIDGGGVYSISAR